MATKNQKEFAKQQARIMRLIRQLSNEGVPLDRLPTLEPPKRVTKREIEILKKIRKKDIEKAAQDFDALEIDTKKDDIKHEYIHRRMYHRKADIKKPRIGIGDSGGNVKHPRQPKQAKPVKPKLSKEELHKVRVEAGKKAAETLRKKYSPEDLHDLRKEWARRATESLHKNYTPDELREMRSRAAKKAAKTLRERYSEDEIKDIRSRAAKKAAQTRARNKEQEDSFSFDDISEEIGEYKEQFENIPDEYEEALNSVSSTLNGLTNHTNVAAVLLEMFEDEQEDEEDKKELVKRISKDLGYALTMIESIDYPSDLEELRTAVYNVASLITGYENPSFEIKQRIEDAIILDLPFSTFGRGYKIYR